MYDACAKTVHWSDVQLQCACVDMRKHLREQNCKKMHCVRAHRHGVPARGIPTMHTAIAIDWCSNKPKQCTATKTHSRHYRSRLTGAPTNPNNTQDKNTHAQYLNKNNCKHRQSTRERNAFAALETRDSLCPPANTQPPQFTVQRLAFESGPQADSAR